MTTAASNHRPSTVVVFASGRGSNFAALLAAQKNGEVPIEIRALLSDKRTAPALLIAEQAGVAAEALAPRDFADRAGFDRAIFARAAAHEPDLIVLAGYMRMIDPAVLAPWVGRCINIHPSLLPKYPGLHTHARALAAGDAVHGSSVHFVTAELDGGPVIARVEIDVRSDDTPETLAARLLPLEHRLLVACVALIANGRVALRDGRVMLDGHVRERALRLAPDGEWLA